jgi:signal transduction histidine kinase
MNPNERAQAETARLKARVSTLEQLLEVYERSVVEQSDRLYAEQERLRIQTTLLASQGEASLDGILSASLDGHILFANHHFAEMWGVDLPQTGERSLGGTLRAVARRCAAPARFLEVAERIEAGERSREEIALADGRSFDRYTAPIRSEEGEILGRVWHFRDITVLKEIGRMKDEFISGVSHELRTPLTSIRGALDLMVNGVMGDLPPDAMSLAKIAQSNCKRLVRLINDVLDIEKMESGEIPLRLELIGLESLVHQAVESMGPYGAELGVVFRIESSIQGARVRADADRLTQVLENLLSNAAKFTPEGGKVRVTLARHGDDLRVCVIDRGPGIAPELHDRVFEKFAQIGTPGARRMEGTGLGLNIARAIVERLGGTIGFDSRRGAGSSFHFDLPEWKSGLAGGPPT